LANYIKNAHLHYDKNKLSNEWCKKASNLVYNNGGCTSLLANKKIWEIEQYASGNIDMAPFIREFKSFDKIAKEANKNNPNYINSANSVAFNGF
jgi:hypothetical protein